MSAATPVIPQPKALQGTPPPPPKTLHALKDPSSLAPFNPTCDQAQGTTLKLLHLTANDVLFDLGCGDARMLMTAAEHTPGLRCVGIELDPLFVRRGREALQKLPLHVQRRVDIRHGDLLHLLTNHSSTSDTHTNDDSDGEMGIECRGLSLMEDATALYLFLLPKGLNRINDLLEALVQNRKDRQQPFRAVAYMFQVHGWDPVSVDRSTKGDAKLYLYKFLPDETETEHMVAAVT